MKARMMVTTSVVCVLTLAVGLSFCLSPASAAGMTRLSQAELENWVGGGESERCNIPVCDAAAITCRVYDSICGSVGVGNQCGTFFNTSPGTGCGPAVSGYCSETSQLCTAWADCICITESVCQPSNPPQGGGNSYQGMCD